MEEGLGFFPPPLWPPDGSPGRTANKAREHLRAVMAWAWEQDLLEALPGFPKPRQQRAVAGRHYLTKEEINALYFATHRMKRPKGWDQPFPVGRFWRCALVVFFNYGVDTGTVWKSAPFHEPILWRHVSWDRESPDREIKEQSRWGWLFYRRVKTGKTFYRPMNHVVHAHIKSIMPENPHPDDPVFLGGGSRPNRRFRQLCDLAGIKPKLNAETGKATPWLLKDLRKTCATYYDEHLPESSIEILGHSVAGVTYRHYAHRGPLAFKAIMTIPQPSAFAAQSKDTMASVRAVGRDSRTLRERGGCDLRAQAGYLCDWRRGVGVGPLDARLASGGWSGVTGRAFHPRDSDERFQSCLAWRSPKAAR